MWGLDVRGSGGDGDRDELRVLTEARGRRRRRRSQTFWNECKGVIRVTNSDSLMRGGDNAEQGCFVE